MNDILVLLPFHFKFLKDTYTFAILPQSISLCYYSQYYKYVDTGLFHEASLTVLFLKIGIICFRHVISPVLFSGFLYLSFNRGFLISLKTYFSISARALLKSSLKKQWKAEQLQKEQIAALAHLTYTLVWDFILQAALSNSITDNSFWKTPIRQRVHGSL